MTPYLFLCNRSFLFAINFLFSCLQGSYFIKTLLLSVLESKSFRITYLSFFSLRIFVFTETAFSFNRCFSRRLFSFSFNINLINTCTLFKRFKSLLIIIIYYCIFAFHIITNEIIKNSFTYSLLYC